MSDLTMFTSENKLGTEYPISQVAENEWKSFAMYTVESRAIPNMIDGLKPVQRFYLYSSILNSKKDFKKVSAVSGIISDYGYNHGEASAAGAGQLMAATWNNNICLIEGRVKIRGQTILCGIHTQRREHDTIAQGEATQGHG